MSIIEVKDRTQLLIEQLLEVWENSVKATHAFLSDEEIQDVKRYVSPALSSVSHLVMETGHRRKPVAFMGIENQRLEMLFVAPECRGKGIGKKLLEYGMEKYKVNELTVNEENPQAKGFYEHMGFKVYRRNALDDQGNPYPVLYMKLER